MSFGLLFSMIQALYPIYHILHLADMKTGGMDRICYYIFQTDQLLANGLQNVSTKLAHPCMPAIALRGKVLSKQEQYFLAGNSCWFMFHYLTSTHC